MNLSWSELMVVAIVALVFIGPKDLPGMFRELGRFTAKIRAMGREFSRAMDAAAKESGVNDIADDLRKVTSPKAMGLDAVRSAADRFEKWDPLKPATKPAAAAAAAGAAKPAGPATAALAEKVAAKKVASAEATAKLSAAKAGKTAPETAAAKAAPKSPAKAPPKAPPKAPAKAAPKTAAKVSAKVAAAAEPPTPKRGGRVRKKPEAGTGDKA